MRKLRIRPGSARSRRPTVFPAATRRRHFRIVASTANGLLPARQLPFWAVHLAALGGVVACGLSLGGVALALVAYFARMALVTAGYHRYFSHRAFKTSRAFQFVLALLAQSSAQKGVAVVGRRTTATTTSTPTRPTDVALAARNAGSGSRTSAGSCRSECDGDRPASWSRTWRSTPSCAAEPQGDPAAAGGRAGASRSALIGGCRGPGLGVLRLHGAAVARHVHDQLARATSSARRRYDDRDDCAQQLAARARSPLGEGWHNNHHHYQSSANQGFFWWEIDVTYYLLRLLQLTGLVWDLRRPPPDVVRARG